jgi:hypothetical protein
LLVTVCVLNHWRLTDLLDYYRFTEHALVQMLATPDRLRLIELQPDNRIKLLVAPNFGWLCARRKWTGRSVVCSCWSL